MRKKAWFFKNRTGLGILGVVLVFGMMAAGCPTDTEPASPTTYTVTFDTDGGSDVEKQTVEEGKTVTKPTAPTKDGYTFVNWVNTKDGEDLWKFDTTKITQDTTIYAKWVEGEDLQRFTVTFNADDGTPVPAKQEIVQGQKVVEPAKPSKEGYTFVGWYKDGGQKWDFRGDAVTAAITLTAKWNKLITDPALAGIWKLTKGGQDYYWDLKADGSGTFHTLGASAPFRFTVTESKEIDGRYYTVSSNTLEFSGRDLTLTKVAGIPSDPNTAGGDSRLQGTWKTTLSGIAMTTTFNSNGVFESSGDGEDGSGIWKADGENLYMYYLNFSSSEGSSIPYSISGSTFTIKGGNGQDVTFTKQ